MMGRRIPGAGKISALGGSGDKNSHIVCHRVFITVSFQGIETEL